MPRFVVVVDVLDAKGDWLGQEKVDDYALFSHIAVDNAKQLVSEWYEPILDHELRVVEILHPLN